jgi:hypothetical protein
VKTALIVGGVVLVGGAAAFWWWRRSSAAAGAAMVMSRYNSIDRSEAGGFVAPVEQSPIPTALLAAASQVNWTAAFELTGHDVPPAPPRPAGCGDKYHWDGNGIGNGLGACIADPEPPAPAQPIPPPQPAKKKSIWGTIGGGLVDVGKAAVGAAVKVEKVQYDQFKKGAALTGADKQIPGYSSVVPKVDGVIRGAA